MDSFEAPDGRFLYYRRDEGGGIWKIPVDGGESVRIREPVLFTEWHVFGHGIAYVDQTTNPAKLKRFNADTKRTIDFGTVEPGQLQCLKGSMSLRTVSG
jgi:hypothetical protein